MIRTQIYLTEEQHSAIGQIAARSGQGRSEVIREAIDDFVVRQGTGSRLLSLRAGRGVWAGRKDLPDVRASRREFDRYSPMSFLFDTDVLIDYLRGHPEAIMTVESRISEAAISTMTVAEIYQGVRDSERVKIGKTLSCFRVLPITEDVAEKGGLFRRDHRHQGAGLADCLIAATCEIHGLTLLTLNTKHYPMLSDVQAPYAKP